MHGRAASVCGFEVKYLGAGRSGGGCGLLLMPTHSIFSRKNNNQGMKEGQLFIILDSVLITVFEDIVCAKSG